MSTSRSASQTGRSSAPVRSVTSTRCAVVWWRGWRSQNLTPPEGGTFGEQPVCQRSAAWPDCLGMAQEWWPFSALRLTTPRVELRFATYGDLLALAQLAFDGIHDEAEMPFGVPWTDAPPEERARATMQWQWKNLSEISADHWVLPFAVLEGDTVVGVQEIQADKFTVCREVHTGSWLGRAHQGRGIGTEMRAAVLHLAFDELGAQWATTTAFEDNAASNGVTRRLGYELDGCEISERRGKPARQNRYRLSRERWEQQDRIQVEVTGVDACRPLLGADWSGD